MPLNLPEGAQKLQSSLVMMSDSGRRSHRVKAVFIIICICKIVTPSVFRVVLYKALLSLL